MSIRVCSHWVSIVISRIFFDRNSTRNRRTPHYEANRFRVQNLFYSLHIIRDASCVVFVDCLARSLGKALIFRRMFRNCCTVWWLREFHSLIFSRECLHHQSWKHRLLLYCHFDCSCWLPYFRFAPVFCHLGQKVSLHVILFLVELHSISCRTF